MSLMDSTDKEILSQLLQNSKQSIKELAKKVNLSVTPVHERIKKMENNGIITGYSANVDIEKLEFKLVVFMNITLVRHHHESDNEIKEYINTLDEVIEGYFVAGDYDVLLKLVLRDMKHYQQFVLEKLSNMNLITNVKSYFVIQNLTEKSHKVYPQNLGL